MKKLTTTILVLALFLNQVNAQIQKPVHWSYGLKRIGDQTYEVHLKADVDAGWHVYAQVQPKNAVAQATVIKFKKADGLVLIGKPKELGKMEKFYNKEVDIGANQYNHTVDFVQVVKIKNDAVTSIAGTITYQACTDHMCLPPEDVNFSIPIK